MVCCWGLKTLMKDFCHFVSCYAGDISEEIDTNFHIRRPPISMYMNYSLFASIIGLCLLSFFMVYMMVYHQQMQKSQQSQAVQQKQVAVGKTLDRFFEKEEKSAKLEKLAAVERIKQEMEAKIMQKTAQRKAKAEVQLSSVDEEGGKIDEAGRILMSFTEGLKTALPSTEVEKAKDMDDLMAAVKALEQIDPTNYKFEEDKVKDLGKGMLYDKYSRKIGKIIKDQNYKDLPFIQAEKLENEAFVVNKRMEHSDYLETLNIMKEIGTIRDIIEINPQTNLIVFSKAKIKLTQAEKVVVTFAADADILTINRLQEQTEWKPAYLNRVLKGLQKKNFLEIKDDNLIILGLITPTERKERQDKINALKEKKLAKKREIESMKEGREEEERKKKEAEEAEKQAELRKLQDKLLDDARIKAAEEAKARREEAERNAEIEAEERLAKIKSMPKPKIAALPLPGAGRAPLQIIKRPLTPVSPQPLPKPVSTNEVEVSKEAEEMAREAQILAQSLSSDNKPEPSAPAVPVSPTSPAIPPSSADLDTMDFSDIPDLDMPPEGDFGEIPLPSGDGFDDDDGGLDDLKAMIAKMEAKNAEVGEAVDIPADSDDLSGFFSDSGDEAISDEVSENQAMIDDIINMLNEIGQVTGGIITLKELLTQLQHGPYPDVKKMELLGVIDEIKEMQIILDEQSFSGTIVYFFEDIVMGSKMSKLMKQFAINGTMDLEDIEVATDWELDEIKRVLKRFEDQNSMVKKNAEGLYYMPGLFNSTE